MGCYGDAPADSVLRVFGYSVGNLDGELVAVKACDQRGKVFVLDDDVRRSLDEVVEEGFIALGRYAGTPDQVEPGGVEPRGGFFAQKMIRCFTTRRFQGQ